MAILRACGARTVRLLRQLDDSIMPLRCVFCGTLNDRSEGRICSGCRHDLPWIAIACPRCAEPLAAELPRGVTCGACQARPSPIRMTVAPLLYEFPVDAGIKALKFGRRLHYAPAFGGLLVEQMPRFASDVDALLPVPLHWQRQAFRGFNQALEICRPLARHCALPIMTGVARRRATPFQSGLTAAQRRRNLRQAFVVSRTPGFRHVLIVDDVVTTGQTTRQLAMALMRRGVKRVSVLAVARAA